MAYTSTTIVRHLGDGAFVIIVDESEAATSSVAHSATLGRVPEKFTILGVQCSLEAGTGTAVEPALYRADPASSPLPRDILSPQIGSSANPSREDNIERRCYCPTGQLWHKSFVNNATADHTIHTEWLCRAGW